MTNKQTEHAFTIGHQPDLDFVEKYPDHIQSLDSVIHSLILMTRSSNCELVTKIVTSLKTLIGMITYQKIDDMILNMALENMNSPQKTQTGLPLLNKEETYIRLELAQRRSSIVGEMNPSCIYSMIETLQHYKKIDEKIVNKVTTNLMTLLGDTIHTEISNNSAAASKQKDLVVSS